MPGLSTTSSSDKYPYPTAVPSAPHPSPQGGGGGDAGLSAPDASSSRRSWCTHSHHLHRASRPPRALPRARLTTDRSVVTAAMVTSQAGRDEKGYQAATGDGQVRIASYPLYPPPGGAQCSLLPVQRRG